MFKKIFVASIAVAVGLFALSHTRMSSYGGTAMKRLKQSTKNQVPVEFEIERIRHEIAQLVPDMTRNLSVLAEEIVSVQNLREDIDHLRAGLDKQKDVIHAMKEDLKSGNAKVMRNGRLYTAERVRDQLVANLSGYKRCEQELTSKEQLLEAKERSLDASREQLASMKAQKQELEIQIAELEANVKAVRLAQTRSQYQLDDSRLAHIKASLADLRTRLKVEKTAAELVGEFSNEPTPAQAKSKSADQVIKEVETYFGDGSKNDSKVAVEKR